MAGYIFISYRRDDEAGTAGRLYDHLVRVANVPRERIFKDVDNIIPGMNFVQKLQSEVAQCELMIAMIGRRWLQVLDEDGNNRLDDPNDFVRIEIEAALNRGIPLIPLLIDGAYPLRANQLPVSLKLLSQQQALDVRNARFDADIARLVKAIEWHQRNPTQKSPDAGGTVDEKLNPQPIEEISGPKHESIPYSRKVPRRKSSEPLDELKRELGGLYYMAEAGDCRYLYEVGTRLESGHGISQNLELALNYYQRAARSGYGRAHVRIERLLPKIKEVASKK